MIFPDRDEALEKFVTYLVSRCTDSARDRMNIYNQRERYFLFGTNGSDMVRFNRIEGHLDLVASFLYAPDHAFYNITAERNASDVAVRQAIALQDDFNDDFNDMGGNDAFGNSLLWSLVYSTMHTKQGWNTQRAEQNIKLIPPHQFGVFTESEPDIDEQECFVHSYALEWYDACNRMVACGRTVDIPRMRVSNTPYESPFPDMLNRMIIAATGGANLQGNIVGQVNPEYTPYDVYQPQTQHPMVFFHELWAWDTEAQDYRTFWIAEPDMLVSDSKKTIKAMMESSNGRRILEDRAKRYRHRKRKRKQEDEVLVAPGVDPKKVSETNLFLTGDHPFTKVQPYPKYNYYWGIAHIDKLERLQDWMNIRFEQIDDLLERQAYPPKVGSGLSGMTDEKFEAFGSPDTFIYEQLPNAKVEELRPDMPEDIFAELREMGTFFLEASGLTEVISGKGEQGVRSRQHARDLRQTGSGRIKAAALRMETPLTRIGDLGLKLKMRNDDDEIMPEGEKPVPFTPGLISTDVKMRIHGHSFSPLFADDAKETAILLKKAEAIDNEMFVRMINPPQKDAILHSLRIKRLMQQKQLARMSPEERIEVMKGGGHKRGGKAK